MICVNWCNISEMSESTGESVFGFSSHLMRVSTPVIGLSKHQFSHQHNQDSISLVGVLSAWLTVSEETEGRKILTARERQNKDLASPALDSESGLLISKL